MNLRRRWARSGPWLAGLLLVLLCSGLPTPAGAEQQAAQPIPFRFYPNRGGDFELSDQQGRPWNLAAARGKVVLLTFGYTHCPDICPMTVSNLTGAWRQLGSDQSNVQGVFVTLDPERDTPQRLAAYLENFESPLVGLTGSASAIQGAARLYHVKYAVRDGGPSLGATIDHSAFIYLIDRLGRLRYLFPHTTPPERLADAARQMLRLAP
jgi:protein SCO1/2